MQEHTEQNGMAQLLGALGHELEAYEAEEGSDSDDGQVSGTDQGTVLMHCNDYLMWCI